MSRIGSSLQSVMLREISNNRTEMEDLGRQLASGKVAESYGGLGSGRTMSLSLRQEMTQIESYQDTITLANTRVKVMDTAVNQLRGHATNMRSQLMLSGFEPMDTGQTLAQAQAETRLTDSVDLLNTQINGRQLFAGAKTDAAPVRPPSEFMDGIGGKAGFRQIMSERGQADLGADGKGRLVIATPAPATVSLAEDNAGSPFGFKLASVSSALNGMTVTGPAGAPSSVSFDFAGGVPNDGEKVRMLFDLPDGTQSEMVLTAKANGPVEEGEFLIDANSVNTATNFKNALSEIVTTTAQTALSAASMQAAADDFFKSGADKVQRVDGPPFDSAVALRDATDADTVEWYTGDKSDTPARETSLARVDDNSVVAYGARADEQAFGTMVKQLAIMSSASFSTSNENDFERYSEMTDRVGDKLSGSVKSQSIDRVLGELAIAQGRFDEANERHITNDNMVTNFLAEIETADINEVGSKLLSMQTQLQASYQVTSMLSKLSLANYL